MLSEGCYVIEDFVVWFLVYVCECYCKKADSVGDFGDL